MTQIHTNQKLQCGFTLIEVLIALTIIAIALTAIVKATSADINSTAYLKDRAIANLVAHEANQLIALKAIAFQGNQAEQETEMSNKQWFWQATAQASNKNIKHVTTTVFLDHKPIVSKEIFLIESTK